ncbi:DUF4386 domain-containing protein [Microbacterium sp.]|uniref:DUF4386 domain-containing protein n=1 Tax=Microbacterium sp. TaxID=51671 RepID=UPI0039E265D7
MHRSPQTYARAAGILYLTTHVTSVTAVVAYAHDAVAGGVALELALALGCVGTGILLWALLRTRGTVRAVTFALLRTVEAAVIVAGTLPMVALLWTEDAAGTPLGDALADVHTASFLVGQGLVISVNTVVLGWLLHDAGVVQRALALLGVGGGLLVLTSNLAQLFGIIPRNGTAAGICAVPVFAFEIWLALHLILRPGRWAAASVTSGAGRTTATG